MRKPPPLETTSIPIDEPLPLTLRFTLVLGSAIAVGWFMMFALLQSDQLSLHHYLAPGLRTW